MSIINDALKKLQNQIAHSNPNPANESMNSAQSELTPAQQAGFQPIPSNNTQPISAMAISKFSQKNKESRLVLIIGILCLLIGLFVPVVNKQSLIVVLISHLPKQVKSSQVVQTKIPAVIASTATATTVTSQPEQKQQPVNTLTKNFIAPASKPSAKNQSRIIINGTMTQGEKNLALIDGQIYEEGDEVDGVKLIKVTPKGVTILENGEERVVKVIGQ
jgi:hypothetical protein